MGGNVFNDDEACSACKALMSPLNRNKTIDRDQAWMGKSAESLRTKDPTGFL